MHLAKVKISLPNIGNVHPQNVPRWIKCRHFSSGSGGTTVVALAVLRSVNEKNTRWIEDMVATSSPEYHRYITCETCCCRSEDDVTITSRVYILHARYDFILKTLHLC